MQRLEDRETAPAQAEDPGGQRTDGRAA
jgi:hypothetical protein